jgi:hypothetical protein
MKGLFLKAANWLVNYKVILVIYLLLAVFASLQSYLGDLKPMVYGNNLYTQYNNYVIFKYSFFHLIDLKDLYCAHPAECGDLYKYSPAFALLFAPFAILPDLVGLSIFNILNALILFVAIKSLPGFDDKRKAFMMWFVLIEMMTSMQNSQTNALIAGLLLLAFTFLEKDKIALATLFIVLTVYIKLFGIVAFSLFLIYPKKTKFIMYTVLWTAILAVIPIIVVPFNQLIFLYKSWGNLLANDHSASIGFSVMGWFNTWFGLNFNKTIVTLIGAVLFMVPFIRFKQYTNYSFRLAILASILIWIIIFNHRAESPTFIIAMAGIALWLFGKELNLVNKIIIISALIFTSFTTTDLFPSFIRHQYLYPYVVKAVPSILIWFWIIYELTFSNKFAFAHMITKKTNV